MRFTTVVTIAVLFPLALALSLSAQTTGTARRGTDNTFSGYNNFSSGSMRWAEKTIATLPAASGVTGKVFIVTDSTSATACTTGGGSTVAICRSNGSIWVAIGGGSAGSGTVTSSGTPLIHQVSVWTTSTDAKGIAVGGNNTVLRGAAAADPAFGSLVKADLPATTVSTDQANTFSTGAQDFSAVTSFKMRLAAGLTAATNGFFGYDTTNHMLHAAQNGADAFIPQFTITPTNGHCANWVVSGSNYKLGSAGAACSAGGGLTSLTSPNSSVAIGGTLSAPTLDVDTTYTNGLYPQLAADNAYTAGKRQTFAPNSTTEGIRFLPSARPSTPLAGAFNVSVTGDGELFDGAIWKVFGTSTLSTAIRTQVKSIPLENPTTADSYLWMFEEGRAITLTRVTCNVIGGTNLVINLRKTTEATSGSGGTAALTSNLTCTAGAFVSSTTFTSATVATRTPVALEIVSASGTNTFAHVFVEYTVDP